MTVFVSFSVVFRFVLWLIVAGALAGAMLVGHAAEEPVEHGEGVTVHADTRDH